MSLQEFLLVRCSKAKERRQHTPPSLQNFRGCSAWSIFASEELLADIQARQRAQALIERSRASCQAAVLLPS